MSHYRHVGTVKKGMKIKKKKIKTKQGMTSTARELFDKLLRDDGCHDCV